MASVAAHAEPARSFPGAAAFPLPTNTDVPTIVQTLFHGGQFASLAGDGVCSATRPCAVTAKSVLHWQDASQHDHLGIAMALEVVDQANAEHAAGAFVGIVDLLATAQGYVINAGSPTVAYEGTYGQAPTMRAIDGGVVGMAVVTLPASEGQGEATEEFNLFLATHRSHVFQLALTLPKALDNSGRCVENIEKCRRNDFSSKITVSNTAAGLTIHKAITFFNGYAADSDFQITP
jgi:hypothetical protein